jgi:hypothetical protein
VSGAEFTAAEQARADAIDAAPPAPESLRETMARAIHVAHCQFCSTPTYRDRLAADAALAVLRGEVMDR